MARPLPLLNRLSPSDAQLAILGPVVIALVQSLFVGYALLRTFDFNPTGPIHLMDHYHDRRFWTESDIVGRGMGYDGQFFYYLAHDPLLRAEDPSSFLDYPAYRYSRILYPTLAWLAALGRPEALPWTLLAVNLLAVLVGTAAAADGGRSLGLKGWCALAFVYSPAVLIGLTLDLAEPSALALIAAGFAIYLRGRHQPAGLVLALAVRAREVWVLVPLGFALHAAGRRAWRQAATYALPLLIPLAWHFWVWIRLGAWPVLTGPSNFGLPLSGLLYRAGLLLGLQPPLLGEQLLSNIPLGIVTFELLVIGLSVGVIFFGLATMLRRRDVFALQFGLQSAAVLCTEPLVWDGFVSYARVLSLLYLCCGLVWLTERRCSERGVRGIPRGD